MQALISLIHKIWDRGVDVAVGVVTTAIIAGIGLLFWRGKLWLDLRADARKQLQQYRIASEFEAERTREEAAREYDRLTFRRDELARAIEEARDARSQALIWEQYMDFMASHNLASRSENLPLTAKRDEFSTIMRAARNMHASPQRAKEIADTIRRTRV